LLKDHHHVEAALDPQHARAHVDVGGVHRDVQRRQALADDALEAAAAEAGQRDVVAVEEAEAVVLVLHVDRLAHPLGILVDEAEDAVAGARLELHRREAVGHGLDVARIEMHGQRLTVGTQQAEGGRALFGGVVVEVEDVLEGAAVDLDHSVAGPPLVEAVQRGGECADQWDHGRTKKARNAIAGNFAPVKRLWRAG